MTTKTENLLRSLIRESILQEGTSYVPHPEVVAAIDNALRPERLDIDIPGFRELMIEIAVVETGLKQGGQLVHDNEKAGGIQGVFQISPLALKQLRDPTAIPKTKERFNKSGASSKPWEKQESADVFGNLKMQAIAACMYTLWIYYNYAKEPGLTSLMSRSNFWDDYYNTKLDADGTAELYRKRVKDLMG